MAEVIMPKMGDAMEEGTLLKWLKAVGDPVSEGDALAEIETDKVTLEMEAQEDGFLTNILVEEGAVVPIGEAVAMIGTEDQIGQGAPATSATPETEAQPAESGGGEPAPMDPYKPEEQQESGEAGGSGAATQDESGDQVADRVPNEHVRASPLVRRLAKEHGIDLSLVEGSGPNGRVVNRDIQDFVSGKKAAPRAQAASDTMRSEGASANVEAGQAATKADAKGELVSMPKIKRTTGKRMAESKGSIPHYYVTASVDMTAALEFRKQVNGALEATGGKVSVNDLIVKAAALALREHPNVNRSFVDGELYQHDEIDINIAIAIDGGLIAPFIPSADQKSLGTIGSMARDLGKRAREGGLTPSEYQGGTFTISNLGMFDVDEFIAVINPPQVAILAVGSVVEMPVVRDGEIAVGNLMKLTLSADHRALDGAEVATFLQSVKKYLENPMLLAIA
jgi:pyruvate dehydrogenase E2 component (dihydrolipoamide acetyltransferase)